MREMFLTFVVVAAVYSFVFVVKTYIDARLPAHEEYVMAGD